MNVSSSPLHHHLLPTAHPNTQAPGSYQPIRLPLTKAALESLHRDLLCLQSRWANRLPCPACLPWVNICSEQTQSRDRCAGEKARRRQPSPLACLCSVTSLRPPDHQPASAIFIRAIKAPSSRRHPHFLLVNRRGRRSRSPAICQRVTGAR